MKKLLSFLAILALIVFSCEKDNPFEQMIGCYDCKVLMETQVAGKNIVTVVDSFKIVNPTKDFLKRCGEPIINYAIYHTECTLIKDN